MRVELDFYNVEFTTISLMWKSAFKFSVIFCSADYSSYLLLVKIASLIREIHSFETRYRIL